MNRRVIVGDCCKYAARTGIDCAGPTSWYAANGVVWINRRSADHPSAIVPDAYPACAIAQFRSRNDEMPRYFVSGLYRTGGMLEQHSSGIEDDIAIEEEIEEETRHTLVTKKYWTRAVSKTSPSNTNCNGGSRPPFA